MPGFGAVSELPVSSLPDVGSGGADRPPPRTNASLLQNVLASWPTGFEYEPRQKGPIAPLTLTYGDQPPCLSLSNFSAILASWNPPDPQPVQARFNAITSPVVTFVPFTRAPMQWPIDDPLPRRPVQIAPLALTYGDQPPRYETSRLNSILASWIPPDPQPRQLPLTIAPLTLTYGQQPPPSSNALKLQNVLTSWPTGFEYQPYQLVRRPPIPAQGDQPPRTSAVRMMQSVLAWPTGLEYQPYQLTESTAAITPVTVVAFIPLVRLPGSILSSWALQDPQPTQRPVTAPIPAQGQQPPRYSTATLSSLVAAWTPPDLQVQRTVPRQIVSVDAPPRTTTRALSAILSAWAGVDAPQQRTNTPAAFSVTIAQPPFKPYPMATVLSWQPEPVPAQARRPIAPLTLTYGQQPPPYVRQRPQSDYYPAPWPIQARNVTAAFGIPVVFVQPPYSRLPASILSSWQPEPFAVPIRHLPASILTTVIGRHGWTAVGSVREWLAAGVIPLWSAVASATTWFASGASPVYSVVGSANTWHAGDYEMAGQLVRNKLQRSPADDSPCFMDFGDATELQATGVTIASCTVAEVTTTALTIGTPSVESNGYRVSVTITGGTDGSEYTIRFYATLSTGKHIERNAIYKVTS